MGVSEDDIDAVDDDYGRRKIQMSKIQMRWKKE